MLYKEWCPTVNARKGRMVEVSKFDDIIKHVRDPGYSSVYAFSQADAEQIIASKSSRGFDKYAVTSSVLPIDLDDGDSSLNEVLTKLSDFKYDLWFSGGKGYHIYLYHDEITSPDLPYSHRQFIQGLDITCDLSLYQHGRIISLPGRIHPKTKKRKTLLDTHEGELINVEVVRKPEVVFNFDEEGGIDDISFALHNLVSLAISEPALGGRHSRLWGVARDLKRGGFPIEAVEAFLLRINETWKNQKPEEEVLRAVGQAYQI